MDHLTLMLNLTSDSELCEQSLRFFIREADAEAE